PFLLLMISVWSLQSSSIGLALANSSVFKVLDGSSFDLICQPISEPSHKNNPQNPQNPRQKPPNLTPTHNY
ncbi:MAG TPA: hypothetical protein VLL52_00005, partial [Anaerolineae bacterium]|nr:hypothetical protein [Anaerolineae bacterium]